MGEKTFVEEFVNGAKDLLNVALIIGLARGVSVIMEDGQSVIPFCFIHLIWLKVFRLAYLQRDAIYFCWAFIFYSIFLGHGGTINDYHGAIS